MAGEGSMEELLSTRTCIWSYAYGWIKSMSLMVAVQLGIPDAVHSHDGPISLSLLASAVGIPECKVPALRRLMRALAHCGVFCEDFKSGEGGKEANEEVYSPTILSKQLVKDSPTSTAKFLLHNVSPIYVTMWYTMATWLREEEPKIATVFEAAHGEARSETLRRLPEFNDMLYSNMACDSRWVVDLVVQEHPEVFQGLTSLVDVGGGNGAAAKAIKDAFPEIRCTVLERPDVVAASPPIEGVDFMEGNMLEHVPPADAVLLKWVLCIWKDDDCVKVLRQCKEAIIPAKERGGKVIVIDIVLGCGSAGNDHQTVEVQHLSDLRMLTVLDGMERNEEEWRRVFADAGFSACKITPALGLRSIIEAYP